MSSSVFDFFQSIRSRESSRAPPNECFICCIKCYKHGKNKIFSKNNVKELKSHLLEFHSIVINESGSIVSDPTQTSEDENEEEEEEETSGVKQKRRILSMWKYIEKSKNGEHVCLLCKADGILTKYSALTSTTNIRLHLQSKHGYSDDEKKTKPFISPVWKYYCKSIRDGKVIDKNVIYCSKCLESGKKLSFSSKTATGHLRKHLLTSHNIDLNENSTDNPDESRSKSQNPVTTTSSIKTETNDESDKNSSTDSSSIRKYFRLGVDFNWCLICEKEKKSQKFSRFSSSTTLKRHLIIKHQIDPFLESHKNLTKNSIPENIKSKVQEIVVEKNLKPNSYFIPIDESENVYCCFCLNSNRMQRYKLSTGASVLRLHLNKVHNVSCLFAENLNKRGPKSTELLSSVQHSITQEIIDRAKVLSETQGLKAREYFVKDSNDPGHVFCVFCVTLKGVKHKYASSTSGSNLRRHLLLKHDWDPIKNSEIAHDDDLAMETNQEVEERVPPVHRVLVAGPATTITTETRDTKYCRSCGSYNIKFFSKFSSKIHDDDEDKKRLTLGEVYSEVTGVQIYADDGMSQLICYPCEANLKTAYHFKTLAVETEDKMTRKFKIDQPIDLPKVEEVIFAEYFDEI